MTADLRHALRQAIDQRVRQLTQPDEGCAGCGGELKNRTSGCDPCNDRHRRRERRQDAAYLERQRAYDRARRRRKKAAA